MISKEYKKDCPLTVDLWMEFLNSEINKFFQGFLTFIVIVFTLIVAGFYLGLGLYRQMIIFSSVFLFFSIVFFIMIIQLQEIRIKIINGLMDRNKIHEVWRKLTYKKIFLKEIFLPFVLVILGFVTYPRRGSLIIIVAGIVYLLFFLFFVIRDFYKE